VPTVFLADVFPFSSITFRQSVVDILDYFSAQAELRSSATHTDVCTTAASSQDETSSPVTEKGADHGSYHTFHIYPLCVNAASIYNHSTSHQMLADFQEILLSCDKLTCDDKLINCSLPFVDTCPQPKKLGCLTKTNLNLISCNVKLDLNMPLDSVTTYSSGIQCYFNDNMGVCIEGRNDLNCFVRESINSSTICNVDSGFCHGLTSTGSGFNPSNRGFITDLSSSTVVSHTFEENVKDGTWSVPEFRNIRSLVSVGGRSTVGYPGCYFGKSIASASGSLFDPRNSKEMYRHLIDKILTLNNCNLYSSYLKNNSLDVSYLLTILGTGDYTSDLATRQSHDMHGSFISTQSSEDSRCTVYGTSVVIFMEWNNSDIPSSSRCVLKACGGSRFTLLNDLRHFCPVLRYISRFSVAQEILNSLSGSSSLHVAHVHSGQIIYSYKHYSCDYKMGNVSGSLSDFLFQNHSNLDHTMLKQNYQAKNYGREAIYTTEWSAVLDQALSCACIENYCECRFSRYNAQNVPNVAELKTNPLRDDLASQITVSKIVLHRTAHLGSTSLIQLYPFCNCLLIHWLFSELLEGPIWNPSFRYLYRPYRLLCFVSKFKSWFLAVSNSCSLRNRLLCVICVEKRHLQC
jgi:hypothetical protein